MNSDYDDYFRDILRLHIVLCRFRYLYNFYKKKYVFYIEKSFNFEILRDRIVNLEHYLI